jgi:adenosylcobinamide kinase / adenosylcobinamide-phosphate guanylyltransferase
LPLIVVGGGARSGKSRFAEELAAEFGPRLGYIATAEALDDEMKLRIAQHREARAEKFITWEEPLDIARILHQQSSQHDAILVDCLTLWLSNLLHHRPVDAPDKLVREFAEMATASPCAVIAVTNEVGCGIVPMNELARRFQDESGRMNQTLVRYAQAAHWVVFGVPLKLK